MCNWNQNGVRWKIRENSQLPWKKGRRPRSMESSHIDAYRGNRAMIIWTILSFFSIFNKKKKKKWNSSFQIKLLSHTFPVIWNKITNILIFNEKKSLKKNSFPKTVKYLLRDAKLIFFGILVVFAEMKIVLNSVGKIIFSYRIWQYLSINKNNMW